VFDHRPEDLGELVGGGGNRRLGPEFGFQAPKPVIQGGLRPVQGLGGHAQSGGQPVVDLAGVRRMGASTGDAVVPAEPQPRGEVLGAGELLHVGAHLAEEGQHGLGTDSLHRGQIDAEPPPIPSNAANLPPWTKSNFLAVYFAVFLDSMNS